MLTKEQVDKLEFDNRRHVLMGFQRRLLNEFQDLSEQGKPISHDLMITMALCQIAVAQKFPGAE